MCWRHFFLQIAPAIDECVVSVFCRFLLRRSNHSLLSCSPPSWFISTLKGWCLTPLLLFVSVCVLLWQWPAGPSVSCGFPQWHDMRLLIVSSHRIGKENCIFLLLFWAILAVSPIYLLFRAVLASYRISQPRDLAIRYFIFLAPTWCKGPRAWYFSLSLLYWIFPFFLLSDETPSISSQLLDNTL